LGQGLVKGYSYFFFGALLPRLSEFLNIDDLLENYGSDLQRKNLCESKGAGLAQLNKKGAEADCY
jgi:hypothetical protein